MARGYRQARPGLHVDADMSEGAYATGLLRGVEKGLRTEAHQNAVVQATHEYFAQVFDAEHMRGVAEIQPENFHHVYEYQAEGEAYSNIGNPAHKLWIHHLQKPRGGSSVATWKWKPATQPVPSYEQRRTSTVGRDAIRNFTDEMFTELIEKSDGKRHVYVWKAVMLEYGIVANIIPKPGKKRLMVPMYGGKKRFAKQWTQGQQAPGDTMGRFTAEWLRFWGERVPKEWDTTVGRFIEKDATQRINTALKSGRGKPRAENRTFAMDVFGGGSKRGKTTKAQYEAAFQAGREQGEAAIKANAISMRGINKSLGWSNALGYADG